jgi:hypothetical protein
MAIEKPSENEIEVARGYAHACVHEDDPPFFIDDLKTLCRVFMWAIDEEEPKLRSVCGPTRSRVVAASVSDGIRQIIRETVGGDPDKLDEAVDQILGLMLGLK